MAIAEFKCRNQAATTPSRFDPRRVPGEREKMNGGFEGWGNKCMNSTTSHNAFKECKIVASHASKHANLSVLARDGAVIGTRYGSYKSIDPSTIAAEAPSSSKNALAENPVAGQCPLGDFHHFALFLETQFGVKATDQQDTESR